MKRVKATRFAESVLRRVLYSATAVRYRNCRLCRSGLLFLRARALRAYLSCAACAALLATVGRHRRYRTRNGLGVGVVDGCGFGW